MEKTNDGRIIEKRVKINKYFLKSILINYKKQRSLTWKDLAKKFGISEYTISHDWFKEHSTIPINHFKKLLRLNKIKFTDLKDKVKIMEPFWGQKANRKSKCILLSFPDINSEEYAEFYGIMLGDGCIYSDMSGFCISGNSVLDKIYYKEYLNNLIVSLFNVNPKIYYSKNIKSVRCVVYNQKIAKFLDLH